MDASAETCELKMQFNDATAALLAAGADPSAKDNEGRTPAYWCKTYREFSAPDDAEKKAIAKLLTDAQTKK